MPEFLLQTKDGMSVVVYSEGDRNSYISKGYLDVSDTPLQTTSNTQLKINSATVAELAYLQGIGRAIAKKIIDNRPYSKVEEILEIAPNFPYQSVNIDYSVD